MVFSHSTVVGPSKTSSISGYEKFEKGIFDVTELKSTFYMNSPEKDSSEKSERSPNFNKSNNTKLSSESQTSGVSQLSKQEHKSPSSTSTAENGSPKTAINPLQNLIPRFIFSNEETADFSPVSSFPEFYAPTGRV